ncbi:MAG: hypothetical protein ACK4HQ_02340 [Brevinematales bacterium]
MMNAKRNISAGCIYAYLNTNLVWLLGVDLELIFLSERGPP